VNYSPEDKKERIAEIFRAVILNQDPAIYKPVGYALRTHRGKFPAELLSILSQECIERAKHEQKRMPNI
jgi:hypothetical protein